MYGRGIYFHNISKHGKYFGPNHVKAPTVFSNVSTEVLRTSRCIFLDTPRCSKVFKVTKSEGNTTADLVFSFDFMRLC